MLKWDLTHTQNEFSARTVKGLECLPYKRNDLPTKTPRRFLFLNCSMCGPELATKNTLGVQFNDVKCIQIWVREAFGLTPLHGMPSRGQGFDSWLCSLLGQTLVDTKSLGLHHLHGRPRWSFKLLASAPAQPWLLWPLQGMTQ